MGFGGFESLVEFELRFVVVAAVDCWCCRLDSFCWVELNVAFTLDVDDDEDSLGILSSGGGSGEFSVNWGFKRVRNDNHCSWNLIRVSIRTRSLLTSRSVSCCLLALSKARRSFSNAIHSRMFSLSLDRWANIRSISKAEEVTSNVFTGAWYNWWLVIAVVGNLVAVPFKLSDSFPFEWPINWLVLMMGSFAELILI